MLVLGGAVLGVLGLALLLVLLGAGLVVQGGAVVGVLHLEVGWRGRGVEEERGRQCCHCEIVECEF